MDKSAWSKGESSRKNGEGLFVVDDTVDSKDNEEEKTREDIRSTWSKGESS